jgi:DNA primase
MIDADEVNRRADLLSLASGLTSLKRVAGTEGGEWAGPCPFCGGRDRFRVQPNKQPFGLWMCRTCTDGKWKDAIDLARRLWPGEKFPELCERLSGGAGLPTLNEPRKPTLIPAAAPPPAEWQRAARATLEETQAALWQPKYKKVLDYLHGRGLRDETIKHFGLGYCATGKPGNYGRKIEGLYIPRGIVIPGIVRGSIWYLKIRLLPGLPCWCPTCEKGIPGPGTCPGCGKSVKYTGVKGNQTAAIFNAENLELQPAGGGPALFVEGEFDCMLAWQEIGDVVPVATLGAATNKPDLATWGRYFLGQSATMLCYDEDAAGTRGAEGIMEMSRFADFASLPDGPWKDITDFHQAGGDLWEWIKPILNQYAPISYPDDFSLVKAAEALGGVVVKR